LVGNQKIVAAINEQMGNEFSAMLRYYAIAAHRISVIPANRLLSARRPTNDAFDNKQMLSYPGAVVILGDAGINTFFHLFGIKSRNSRLI
jgi:hypothetical protein